MSRGLFVVLEGIDGSGKSEQTQRLVDWLVAQGERVVRTCEPTDGVWGRRYRRWARGEEEAEPLEVLRYFVEDRREHVRELIAPALARGDVVVCDRYLHSTLAYQVAQGLERERVRRQVDTLELPAPDLVLWLRLPVERALARLGAQATERFERAAFLERVDTEYGRLGLEALDASGSPAEVAERVRERVRALLAKREG